MIKNKKKSPSSSRYQSLALITVLLIAVGVYHYLNFTNDKSTGDKTYSTNAQPISLDDGLIYSIDKTKKIRAGYGVFPPYSQEDPVTGKVTGINIDIINEIARQIGVSVEWKRFNWNTMSADLKRGEYDILADSVFQTPMRGREFSFTEPYAYFAIGIGVVKHGEKRFSTFNNIDKAGIKVAVGQGFAEETFLKSRISKAEILSVPSQEDTAAPINYVLTGRADIAIVNLEDAKRFVKANSKNLDILWESDPPAYIPSGFALKYNDITGTNFLNVSLRYMRTTGVLEDIFKRYNVKNNYDLVKK